MFLIISYTANIFDKMIIAGAGSMAEAWRVVLDDLVTRGLRRPEFLIVDGAPGLDKAIAASGTACRSSGSAGSDHALILKS
jgi:Transposase, Mutator family